MRKQHINKISIYTQLQNWLSVQYQKRNNKRRQRRELVEWEADGRPVPPPHIVKQHVIKEFAKKYHLNTFVETGTFHGDMVEAMMQSFDKIVSIELNPILFKRAKERFKTVNHVQILHGDSSRVLEDILGEIQSPALFWLDAHYSGGMTAKGEKDTPIIEELKLLLRDPGKQDVIIIDDARLFGSDPAYPALEELINFIKSKRDNVDIEIKDDSIRVTPKPSPSHLNKFDRSKYKIRQTNICKIFIRQKVKLVRLQKFMLEYQHYVALGGNKRFKLDWSDRYPCLEDNIGETHFDAHYIYHPAWAARILAQTRPSLHTDISSTLQFCTIVSAFIPVEFYDYRPADLSLSGLYSKCVDLTRLPFTDNSIGSLSCMHVVEHIGLGRYGDPLDPNGDLKAIAELKRVLAKGGALLFVTPVGKPKNQFNAHRIYSYEQITACFSDFQMEQFALVNDYGQFSINASPADANQQNYGCGCWWFKK